MDARGMADLILVLHALFVAFAVFGALLALRWRWTPWLHLPAALWAAGIEALGGICPLTRWENHYRALAGQAGIGESFIERHLFHWLYPDGLTREIQWGLAALVVLFNAVVYLSVARVHRRANRLGGPQQGTVHIS